MALVSFNDYIATVLVAEMKDILLNDAFDIEISFDGPKEGLATIVFEVDPVIHDHAWLFFVIYDCNGTEVFKTRNPQQAVVEYIKTVNYQTLNA